MTKILITSVLEGLYQFELPSIKFAENEIVKELVHDLTRFKILQELQDSEFIIPNTIIQCSSNN